MTNLVVAWRAKKLFEISVARGGDWVDESVSKVRRVPVGKVTHEKERNLKLGEVDPRNALHLGLEIYYEELIRHVLREFSAHFKTVQTTFTAPMEVVIAGGTASVPGFLQTFERCLEEEGAPVPIRSVRMGQDPLRTVAKGALVAAVSMEKKKLKAKAAEEAKAKAAAKAAQEAAAKVPAPRPAGELPDVIDVS